MARRRRFNRKRRTRQRGFVQRIGDINLRQIASKVKWIVQQLNVEKKFLDTTAVVTPDNATGTSTYLTDIPTGTTSSTRTGNQCKAVSISGKLTFTKHASATMTDLRIMLVRWNQVTGVVTPDVTNILQNVSTLGHYSKSFAGDFKVFWDRRFTLDANFPVRDSSFYFKISDIMRWFTSDTSGDENQALKNSYFLMCISTEATNVPTVNANIRVMYVDN